MSTQGRLLIVDDELSVRDSLAKWFHEEGYEVGIAEDANNALTRLAEGRWDAALLDIKMHGIDGIELQRRIHEIDPELIVIMMTGYASVETAVRIRPTLKPAKVTLLPVSIVQACASWVSGLLTMPGE